jgi:hypothetical protein
LTTISHDREPARIGAILGLGIIILGLSIVGARVAGRKGVLQSDSEGKTPIPCGLLGSGEETVCEASQLSPGQGRKLSGWAMAASIVAILASAALWWMSIPAIDPRGLTDYGLASVTPPTFFVAFALLTVSFCLLVCLPYAPVPLLLGHVFMLVVMIHGTLPLVYDVPRYSWTYKHIGVASYIQHYGTVDPAVDIYHSWPAFFALSALLTDLAGLSDALGFAAWMQLFFNALYLGALLIVFRALTRDRRLIWLAVWFFYLANWIGQDYFSPQAISYFMYLIILGACLTWLRPLGADHTLLIGRWAMPNPLVSLLSRKRKSPLVERMSRETPLVRQRVVMTGVVMLLFLVTATGHQLTPWVMIASVASLVVFRRCGSLGLPLVMTITAVSWVVYMSGPFVYQQGHWVLQTFGHIFSNSTLSLFDSTQASPGRVFVSMATRALTVVVLLLAVLGFIRQYMKIGCEDPSAVVLAVSPMPVMLIQYGGETLFRAYLFALPFLAFLAAALLFPAPTFGRSLRTAIVAILVSGILLFGFTFAYFGNEKMNHMSRDEVVAVQELYRIAKPGSLILALNENSPLKLSGYEQFTHRWLSDMPQFKVKSSVDEQVGYIVRLMTDEAFPATYLLVTRGQEEDARMLNLQPSGSNQFTQALVESRQFSVVFANSDATLFTVRGR